MFKPIVFADLDDTLFQSLRKVPENEKDGMRFVSEANSGNHSYVTLKQQMMFQWLSETTRLIPVTARSTRSFSKVELDFGKDWRILGNGAVVVRPDGEIDQEWHARLLQEALSHTETIEDLKRQCEEGASELGLDIRILISNENGLKHSVVVKENDLIDSPRLNRLIEHVLVPEGWHSHLNGNNLAFTIPGVSKRLAVEYVHAQIDERDTVPVFGFGDSLTDIPFMRECDMFCTPTRGQIAETYRFTKKS